MGGHVTTASPETPRVDQPLKRAGSISYLHIPAADVHEAARFYEAVFGWIVRDHDSDRPTFDDGSGYVSGAWMTDQAVAREPGLLLYISVEHIDQVIASISARGGEIVRAPYPEGSLRVATFRDPAGNVLGLWEEAAAGGR
ncbi:MAG TPA: VOC family protein [Candidatus Saccharimonadales bacterium]|nr:VOC family protein [Candidatus Saccharimonadales bacterium]